MRVPPSTASISSTPSTLSIPPRKASIRGAGLLPRIALVDPDLTLTCPPDITAHSGMDALTQAVESFVSIHAFPLTDALALAAVGLLARNLLTAYRDGQNRSAREACSAASLMAGLALANARLGVVHGIAHPLGVRYHIPHGLCCAVLLPASVRLNRTALRQAQGGMSLSNAAAADKYGRLSRETGGDILDVVEHRLDQLHIPRTLAAYHIPPRDFPAIADEALTSGSLKANPRPVNRNDVIRVLHEVTGTQ